MVFLCFMEWNMFTKFTRIKVFQKQLRTFLFHSLLLSANVKRVEKKGWFFLFFDRSTKPLFFDGVWKRIHPMRGRNFSQWKRDFRSLSMILTIWKQEL